MATGLIAGDGLDQQTCADLAERMETHVTRRAGGQIRDLRVLVLDGRIVLRGRSRTYHAKQLAQEAILELAHAFMPLANEIDVC